MRLPLLATIAALLLFAPPGMAVPAGNGDTVRLQWPQPPGQARIEYSGQFSRPEDLGLRKPLRHRLRNFLAGKDDRILARPYAVAVDAERVVVADPDSAVVHLFETGKKKYRLLDHAGKQPLRSPIAAAIGGDRLYVADSVLQRVFVFDRRLKLKRSIGGFERPVGLAFAALNQRLYVSDAGAHDIRVFAADGSEVQVIGERGAEDGQFNYPSHIAVTGDKLVVNDTLNFRIQVLGLDGSFQASFGHYGLAVGAMAQSKGVAVDPDGHIYVADARTNRVQVFDSTGEFLLVFGRGGDGPGQFNMPAGLAFAGNRLYVADSFNRRIQVFHYLPEEP